MVHIALSSTKGNQGLRYFPYSGYLGLTPIRVEGLVRTRKLDDDDKQIKAKSITISVRCYESRIGRVSTLHSNILVDYTQVLWSKPDGVDYAPISEMEFPFRISIPAKVAGFSTAVFVDYRCMWRVEAVLNHTPISGVGSRQIKHFELPLIRYDLPPHQPTPSGSEVFFQQQTTKPRAPKIRYCIDSTPAPIGPLDLVPIPIHLLPIDTGVNIRSASVIIERRIQLNETPGITSPLETPASSSSSSSSSNSNPLSLKISPPSPVLAFSPTSSSFKEPVHINSGSVASTFSFDSSHPTITPHTLYPSTTSVDSDASTLLQPSPYLSVPTPASQIPTKVIVTPIAGAESSGQFARDKNGVWSKTLTIQWPAAKSHSRWAIGETIQSELVSVKYFIRVKIVVSSPTGTESIELAEKELLVVSTNDAERQVAMLKYNELMFPRASTRSKSKSPRRSKRERDSAPPPSAMPPSPADTKSAYAHRLSSASASAQHTNRSTEAGPSIAASKGKAPVRRPHTSAGPWEGSFDRLVNGRRGTDEGGEPPFRKRKAGDVHGGGTSSGSTSASVSASATGRPESSRSEMREKSGIVGRGYSFFTSSPRMSAASSRSTGSVASGSTDRLTSGSTSGNTSISSSSSRGEPSGGEEEEEGEMSAQMKEWREELVKIETRSKRSSDMLGFVGKLRQRSFGAPKVPGSGKG